MESGLEGRNNGTHRRRDRRLPGRRVSMESGLEGRNNSITIRYRTRVQIVSMESGLEGRNNTGLFATALAGAESQWSPA